MSRAAINRKVPVGRMGADQQKGASGWEGTRGCQKVGGFRSTFNKREPWRAPMGRRAAINKRMPERRTAAIKILQEGAVGRRAPTSRKAPTDSGAATYRRALLGKGADL